MSSHIYPGTVVKIQAGFPVVPSEVTFTVPCAVQGNSGASTTYTTADPEVVLASGVYTLTYEVPANAIPRTNKVKVVGAGGTLDAYGNPADVTRTAKLTVERTPT